MNPILEWGIRLIVGLQQTAPWLRGPMQLFTFLGNEEFFFFFMPFVYWCVDARLGVRVSVLLILSNSIKVFCKFAFHQPRPYWISNQVQAMSSESSYGLPSGHAQDAASMWGILGALGKRWLRWLMVALIFLIGFSRIFLAVHFPTDVLAGWLIGGLLLWAFLKWEEPVLAWFKRHTLGQQMGLVLATSLAVIAFSSAGLIFAPPADPPEWAVNAALAVPPAPGEPAIEPRDTTFMVGVAGSFFGFAAGVILLFRRGNSDARARWSKRVMRFVIGLVGVLILWRGLQMIFPRDATPVSQILRYLRYALAGFWIAYGAPWVFIRFKL